MGSKNNLEKLINQHLINIKKPGRYTGGEFNEIRKKWQPDLLKFALAFPDIYDIGLSNLGLAILYDEINNRTDALAERLYAPWPDMEGFLRKNNLPLFSLENKKPAADFDILGFSIPYETLYTNVLNMLDLSRIPIRSLNRNSSHPIVIAGGHACFNPEPMYAFIDAFVIGEGEVVIHEIIELVKSEKSAGAPREKIIDCLSEINGVYIPSHFTVDYRKEGKISNISNVHDTDKLSISKRFMERLPEPVTNFLVPNIKTVQDRIVIEIMRGCSRGCRFCQAGMITRPVRERSVDTIIEAIEKSLKATGFDEVSLLSLSTSDYSQIKPLLQKVNSLSRDLTFEFSLPSLRIESFSDDLMKIMHSKRKGNFTIAPEAASETIRNSINKPITDEDLFKTVEDIFQMGWRNLKLYFMIGFPGESIDDVERIAYLCQAINKISKKILHGRGIIHISVNTLIPKPHTSFQWVALDKKESIEQKYRFLLEKLKKTGIKVDWSDYDTVFLEAALSRGDRRVADVIEYAWKLGAKFDAWHEFFQFSLWAEAFKACSVDANDFVFRNRMEDEILPWDHINIGVTKEFLYNEFLLSQQLQLTADCSERCSSCGIQSFYGVVCNQLREIR